MNRNKKIILSILSVLFLASCLNLPKMPELNSSTEKTIKSVKQYLKCETVSYEITREEVNDSTSLYLTFIIYDVKKKNPNLDSINVVLMKAFEQNDFKLKSYTRINFFYDKDYDNAKLLKGFRFNGDGELIEEFYK